MQQTECFPSNSQSYFALEQIEGIKDVSLYMGGTCNFDCEYCDRSYIKGQGLQKFEYSEKSEIFLFQLLSSFKQHGLEFPILSFHGGETLLFIKTIQRIIEDLQSTALQDQITFYIQTNGSLILKNKEFFEKYKNNLYISISYDFIFQAENRTALDIEPVLAFLDDLGINKQIQFVIPTLHKNPFNPELVYSILSLYSKYKIQSLNLILLRHIRETSKFRTVIAEDSVDLPKLFSKFIQFFQILHVSGINLAIDGHTLEIEKNYYTNHKQIVLAPDGLIYPEYQFIEYKAPDYNIGSWETMTFKRVENIDPLLSSDCVSCPQKELCGLQYYYSMFGMNPANTEKCRSFYSFIDLSIRHLAKLKKQKNLLAAIGI
jgi:sulfatase maturation enzyme AslB (radical SAM superfamily)